MTLMGLTLMELTITGVTVRGLTMELTLMILIELLELVCTFLGLWDKNNLISRDLKMGKFAVKKLAL